MIYHYIPHAFFGMGITAFAIPIVYHSDFTKLGFFAGLGIGIIGALSMNLAWILDLVLKDE